MTFSILDIAIIIAYLIGIALFGVFAGGRQTSTHDYFLSEKAIPWWAVCFTIVATETSALTFISLPGIAYVSNLNFLQLSFGYIIGRILIARVFLPRYFEGELSTAYAFIGKRFSPGLRRASSIVFMFTRLFADGVRLYTTAIPLALLMKAFHITLGLSDTNVYLIAIVILALLTLVYVYLGGVRAVIWTDVIQLFIYIAGGLVAVVVLLALIPSASFEGMWSAIRPKLNVFHPGISQPLLSFFADPLTTFASVIGGAFLSMASHGTDQIIIQRVLTTNDLRKSQKAMITSGIIIFFQFLLFLGIGILLYVYYNGASIPPNEVFSKFIIEKIPTGIAGLIIAGILAAAMSTLSGSISALASSTMMDIILPLTGNRWRPDQVLRISRRISLFWGMALILVALIFIGTPTPVVELALSIASYTYGGLLGLFLTGILSKKIRTASASAGFAAGIVCMTCIILYTNIAWTWYTLIGACVTFIVSAVVDRFTRPLENPAVSA
jgi:solute:Na+ symporter, SSS family